LRDAGSNPDTGPVVPSKATPTPPTTDVDAGQDSGGAYEPTNTGFSFGFRGSYAVPFGQANAVPLNGGVVIGMIPIGADMGWFFSPHFYVGGYFQYGFGIGPGQTNLTCSDVDVTCSAEMYRFGAVVHWHFKPESTVDPWLGAGLGYEIVNLVATSDVDDSTVTTSALQALDLTLEAGLDLKPLRYLGIGPFVEVATGPYIGAQNASLHGWASFGMRFRSNL
jgi:hypothetical protein